MVTDRDIVVRALAEGKDPTSTSVNEVWSTDLAAVRPDEDSDQAVRLMRQRAAVAKDPNSAVADISAAPPNE